MADGPLETGEWLSYNPLHGTAIPQQTKVWIGHDADYLYFAFQCDDPEPSGIKTSITRRDNIWSDDWVGLSLDALGTGQLSYHLMVNPSGVQLDMLNSVAGRRRPVARLRLGQRRPPERPGLRRRDPRCRCRRSGSRAAATSAWASCSGGASAAPACRSRGRRSSPASGSSRSTPRWPSTICSRGSSREIIPSTTYARTESRDTPSRWGAADDDGDVGLSGKYGLTSTVTLDATVNPDFSQVESDAFQVEVNQRFPVFFSEKRPFFMEGAGIFTLAGQGSDNSLQRAVHTRRIVDPVFGAKLTGSVGRLAFGTLTALDQAAGRNLPAGDPDDGKDRLFNVGRAQYSLGRATTSAAGRRHRVRRRLQPGRRRRPLVAGDLDAARHRLRAPSSTRASARRRRIDDRRRRAGRLRVQHAAAQS